MRKFYLIILLVAFTAYSFAQTRTVTKDAIEFDNSNIELLNNTKTPTDTLAPYGIANASGYALYPSTGGYVTGVNDWGDLAKAQVFPVTSSYAVEGCLIWVGAKEIVGTAGTVDLNLYQLDATGTTSGGTGDAPGTISATVSLDMDMDIDTTGGFSGGLFASPVYAGTDYAVGLDFTSIGDDTIGVIHSEDGDPQGEYSWEKWSDGDWYTILGAWGVDIDMAFLPIVDMVSGNINDHQFVNGVKVEAYPNPTTDYLNVDYQLQKESEVKFMILDMTGKIVLTENLGQKSTGMNNTTISTSNLEAGVYFYVIEAGSQRLAKKLVVK